MFLLNVSLRCCRLPRESQVFKHLDPTGEDWTTIREEDLSLPQAPISVTWRRNFTTTLTGIAQKFVPEAVLKVNPHAIPPWGLPRWGNRLAMDSTISTTCKCKRDSRRTLIREIHTLSGSESSQVLLVYAADGTAPQGEGNDLQHWYAVRKASEQSHARIGAEQLRRSARQPQATSVYFFIIVHHPLSSFHCLIFHPFSIIFVFTRLAPFHSY